MPEARRRSRKLTRKLVNSSKEEEISLGRFIAKITTVAFTKREQFHGKTQFKNLR